MPAFDPQVSRFASLFARAAKAATAFEEDWLAGRSPQLLHYLPEGDSDTAELAFLELLRIEIRIRRAEGKEISLSALTSQFAQHQSLLEEFFAASDECQIPTKVANGSTVPGAMRPALAPQSNERISMAGYRILEQIGEGGMGVVYRAIQPGANRIVALKVIRPVFLTSHRNDLKKEVIYRFLQEARATAKLSHENIVTVYEVGEIEDDFFLSMQFLAGDSLAIKLQNGPIPPTEAAKILEQVCRGLQFAHQQGVIHRDIKPSNILFDGCGKALISDFGLAKVADESVLPTPTGLVLGTPAYMPPEQFSSPTEITAASDIYSVGVTLYQMLTGRPPFAAAEPLEVLRQVAEMNPVLPRTLNPSIPRDLETITLKCLEKQPSRRYRRASDLADDLKRFREGKPIQARRVSAVEKCIKWASRNPTIASSAATVLLLAILLTGLTTWHFVSLAAHQNVKVKLEADAKLRNYELAMSKSKDSREDKTLGWTVGNVSQLTAVSGSIPDTYDLERFRSEYLAAAMAFGCRELGPVGPALDEYGLAWSPNGEWLARGGNTTEAYEGDERIVIQVFGGLPRKYQRSIRIKAPDQEQVRNGTFVEGVRSLAFTNDGRQLIIGARSGRILVVDFESGDLVHQWKAHEDKVLGLSINPEGDVFFSISRDQSIKFWSVGGWKQIRSRPTSDGIREGNAGIWLADRVVVSGRPPVVMSRQPGGEPPPAPTLPEDFHIVAPLRGHMGFVAVSGEKINLVDCFAERVLTRTFALHGIDAERILSVSISPNQRWIALCTPYLVRIYDLFTGMEVQQISIQGAGAEQVSFDPLDGSLWVTMNDRLFHYEIRDGEFCSITKSDLAPDFTKDGQPPTAHLWLQVTNGDFRLKPIKKGGVEFGERRFLFGQRNSRSTDAVTAMNRLNEISNNDDMHQLVVDPAKTTLILNIETQRFLLNTAGIDETCASFSLSPSRVIGACNHFRDGQSVGQFAIHHATSEDLLLQFFNDESQRIKQRSQFIDVQCCQNTGLALSADQSLRVFELSKPRLLGTIDLGSVAPIQIATDLEMKHCFVGTEDGEIIRIDVRALTAQHDVIRTQYKVLAAAVSRSGILATSSPKGRVDLWDTNASTPTRICSWNWSAKAVDYLEFSENGDRLALHFDKETVVHEWHIDEMLQRLKSLTPEQLR